jgi:hypothetical protein
MNIDTEKLEALALAATPGPWYAAKTTMNTNPFYVVPAVGIGAVAMIPKSKVKPLQANAEFIAAANPAVVLELLAEIKRLKAEQPGKITIDGNELKERDLIWGVIANLHGPSRYRSKRGTERWVLARNAFGCGSTVANGLCREFGFDPDEELRT